MPIQVYIEINGNPITTIHVGRLKGGTNSDDINVYTAVAKDSQVKHLPDGRRYTIDYPSNHEWDNGAIFEHRYGDGVEACVERAIQALRAKEDLSFRRD